MKKIIAVLLLLLVCTVFISGCIEEQKIKSSEEADNAMINISSGVERVGEVLEDIDQKIG